MKVARILLRLVLAWLAVVALVVALILGIRAWNQSKIPDVSGLLPEKPPVSNEVTVSDFASGYARGYHLQPKNQTHPGTVVTFGGSSGGVNATMAGKLADQGHEVYALNFYGKPGQKQQLERVPLELFGDVLPNLSKPITVLGSSKGAELALLLATHYPEIDNVVVTALSAYHWQALAFGKHNAPSFTWENQDLPCILFSDGDQSAGMGHMVRFIVSAPVSFRYTYESALQGTPEDKREQARIKIERSNARIFLAAGEQDELWDSAGAAREIKKRVGDRAELHIYPEAGHAEGAPPVVPGLRLGGTEEANKAMEQDIQAKLAAWLP